MRVGGSRLCVFHGVLRGKKDLHGYSEPVARVPGTGTKESFENGNDFGFSGRSSARARIVRDNKRRAWTVQQPRQIVLSLASNFEFSTASISIVCAGASAGVAVFDFAGLSAAVGGVALS
jgi:hypothetical protein